MKCAGTSAPLNPCPTCTPRNLQLALQLSLKQALAAQAVKVCFGVEMTFFFVQNLILVDTT